MTLSEMQYIVALAESLHFGQAAKRCGVSQSNLSMSIKKIETELQATLFERTRHSVLLTDFGKNLVMQLQKVISRTQYITDLAVNDQQQLTGDLHVGAPFSLGPYIFPTLAAQWRVNNTSLALHFVEAENYFLFQKIRNCELDLLITTQAPTDTHLLKQEIFSEGYALVMPNSHALSQHSSVSINQLAQHKYLRLNDHEDLNKEISTFFTPTLLEPCDCTHLETLRHLIIAGLGFSIVPTSIANAWCKNTTLQMRPIDVVNQRHFYLIWRTSYTRTKVIDLVRQNLQKSLWPFVTTAEKEISGLMIDNDNW